MPADSTVPATCYSATRYRVRSDVCLIARCRSLRIRAGRPPTLSSLAGERRATSLLRSTAARDPCLIARCRSLRIAPGGRLLCRRSPAKGVSTPPQHSGARIRCLIGRCRCCVSRRESRQPVGCGSELPFAGCPETSQVSTSRSRTRRIRRFEHPQLVPYAPSFSARRTSFSRMIRHRGSFAGKTSARCSQDWTGPSPTSDVPLRLEPQDHEAAGDVGTRRAHRAGLLTERGVAPYRRGSGLVAGTADRAGPVGYQIARMLVASGLGTFHADDNEPPDPVLYPTAGVLTSRAEALRSALAEAGTTICTLSHWSKPEAAPLDLTIMACDRPEVDRVITDHLMRIDQPHLVVRCCGNGVSVGPLVLAGQTSCVSCADLARSDADPHWPVVLTQLSRLRVESSPALLAWAASVAVAQALAYLHGELPEAAGATLELSWPDFVTRLRRWPAHPSCGCGWLSQTEWGHERPAGQANQWRRAAPGG